MDKNKEEQESLKKYYNATLFVTFLWNPVVPKKMSSLL